MMQSIFNAYRSNCNALTIRISELSSQMQFAHSHNAYKKLYRRKQLLLRERLELLQDMDAMRPYCKRGCLCEKE